jgi:RNA polymerase sigma-32 factor
MAKRKKQIEQTGNDEREAPIGLLPRSIDIEEEGPRLPVAPDPLKHYLREISKYPLLTRKEERKLAERVFMRNDRDAAQKLVVSNLKLVVKIALGYYNAYQNIRDLIQEGNVGLMHAVRKYNPYKGTKFSTYASFWIKAYMLKFIRQSFSIVKVGTTENEKKLFYGLNKEKRRLEGLGMIPLPAVLAENLSVSKEEIEDMERRLSSPDLSLDQALSEDGEETFMDMVKGDDNIEEIVTNRERKELADRKIAEFKKLLNEKELYIFEHRTVAEEPMTLQEIGEQFHMSRERARQIEKGVTAKVAKHLIGSLTPAKGEEKSEARA